MAGQIPSGRCRRRRGDSPLIPQPESGRALERLVRPVLLACILALSRWGFAAEPAGTDLEDALGAARRLARESVTRHGFGPDPFAGLVASGGLFAARARLARAAFPEAPWAQPPAPLDAGLLGLPDLDAWLALASGGGATTAHVAGSTRVPALVAFARRAVVEPLSRLALVEASHAVRTPAERQLVLEALTEWEKRSPGTPRAIVASGLARARLATSPAAEAAAYVSVCQAVPDAPERSSDQFTPDDRRAFDRAVRTAPAEVRLARAAALVSARAAPEAARLVEDLGSSPPHRLAVAETFLAAGYSRRVLEVLLRDAPCAAASPEEISHREALSLTARLRMVAETREPQRAGRRSHRTRRSRRPAISATGPDPAAVVSFTQLSAEADRLLARPLGEADLRRLLAEAVRAATRVSIIEAARSRLDGLLAIEPTSTAGAEELFRLSFTLYRRGGKAALTEAASLFEMQAALYRDVLVRRRATYWAARARGRAGETEAAKPLYAALLTGPVPDLYGRWAAIALGVPLPLFQPPAEDAPEEGRLSASVVGSPSRELFAVGLPGPAEDAAELEGTLEPFFAASLASERGDYRRALGILKRRYPELGTPGEAAVPARARRAFYPLAATDVLEREARENGLPPALLCGVIRQESLFQTTARSRAGAQGLMQVMPATGRTLARREGQRRPPDLSDPRENVKLGARYLAQMLALFGGDEIAALASYNAGPGRLLRWRRESPELASDEFLEAMPMSEPREYVKRVLFFEGAYAAIHGVPLAALPREVVGAPASGAAPLP